MKRVVLRDEFREADIRPAGAYHQYQEILEKECRRFFGGRQPDLGARCRACQAALYSVFERWGALYGRCEQCLSLFVLPQFSDEEARNLLNVPGMGELWREQIINPSSPERMRLMIQPRIDWLLEVKDQYAPQARCLIDYGSKYPQFLEGLVQAKEFDRVTSVDPDWRLGNTPWPDSVEKLSVGSIGINGTDLMAAFDVLERVHDPAAVIGWMKSCLRPGGLAIVTTALSTGLEYLVLGAKAPNLNPIERRNLFSLEALSDLLTRHDFELLELSTTGRLDVELVARAMEEHPKDFQRTFWWYFFHHRGPEALQALQEFVQQHQLSSHCRLVARRLGS
ncbi:MAG: methyltransferase domain-containing protein [Elusimicrobia bacterium]|nr:methyltransferase domain-containing protein [Elusimicrobiota bacterium]